MVFSAKKLVSFSKGSTLYRKSWIWVFRGQHSWFHFWITPFKDFNGVSQDLDYSFHGLDGFVLPGFGKVLRILDFVLGLDRLVFRMLMVGLRNQGLVNLMLLGFSGNRLVFRILVVFSKDLGLFKDLAVFQDLVCFS